MGSVGSDYDVIQACVELTQCLANPTRGQPNHIWDPVGFCHSAMGRKAMILRSSPPERKCLYSSIRDHEETLTRHGLGRLQPPPGADQRPTPKQSSLTSSRLEIGRASCRER